MMCSYLILDCIIVYSTHCTLPFCIILCSKVLSDPSLASYFETGSARFAPKV